ncbi:MAG: hypothetical protein AAF557_20245 [Pseudomonadota bacterium]
MFRFFSVLLAVFWMATPVQADSFRAANGSVLPAPDLNTMTCEKLDHLMMTYMASHYRDVQEVPKDHPDRPIFEYENRMAKIHYEDCQIGANYFQDSSPAFSKGFN